MGKLLKIVGWLIAGGLILFTAIDLLNDIDALADSIQGLVVGAGLALGWLLWSNHETLKLVRDLSAEVHRLRKDSRS